MNSKRKSNMDIVVFLREKEKKLINNQYDLMIEDIFNYEDIDRVNKKIEYLNECREKLYQIIKYQNQFDEQVNKLLAVLEDL